jgi:hypothetical protein
METPPIKDSGNRRDFGTGAVRDAAAGKGRFDLLPYYGVEAVAMHFERGSWKYAARNWEMGIPLRCYLDSAYRHIAKAANGLTDEPHPEAFVWNGLCYLHTRKLIQIGALPTRLLTELPADLNVDDPESIRSYLDRMRQVVEQCPAQKPVPAITKSE